MLEKIYKIILCLILGISNLCPILAQTQGIPVLNDSRYQKFNQKFKNNKKLENALPVLLKDPQSIDLHSQSGFNQVDHEPVVVKNAEKDIVGKGEKTNQAVLTQAVTPTQNAEPWEVEPISTASEVVLRVKSIQISTDSHSIKTQSEGPSIGTPQSLLRPLLDHDWIESTPHFQVSLLSTTAPLLSWQMKLINASQETVGINTGNLSQSLPRSEFATLTIVAPLQDGEYTLQVQATDQSGSTRQLSVTGLKVETSLRIHEALLGPNPFNPTAEQASIEYQLTQPASVQVTIMAIDGHAVFKTTLRESEQGAQAGFNKITWNGRDQSGSPLSNGPYVIYIYAEKDGVKTVKKVKCLIKKSS